MSNYALHTTIEVAFPVVSIIIPCYNQACYLAEAVESALKQTYSALEVLVIDDGSTDTTREVATHYPAVRYVHQANQGVSAARNTGIQHSTGDYLVFLDADDRLLPTAVATNLAFLESDATCAFAAGHYRYIDANGTPSCEKRPHRITSDHYRALLERNYIGMPAVGMYRRAVFDEIGLFDSRFHGCEDYDMYLRIAQRHAIHCHSVLVAEYRRHGAGLSNNAAAMLTTALRVLAAQKSYIDASGDARLQAAYRVGVRSWRNLYGRELLLSIGQRVARRDWRGALHRTRVLLPHIPGGAWWCARQALRPGVRPAAYHSRDVRNRSTP